MKKIDISSIRILDSFAHNKSRTIFFRNLDTLKSTQNLDYYIVLKGKFTDGEKFKKELKVSLRSYHELSEVTLENIKRDYMNNYSRD